MATATANPPTRNVNEFEAMRLVRPPVAARWLAMNLLALLIATAAAMLLLPWQQTSRGSGRVVAFDPTERPQTVESPIYGRVVQWGEGIYEGVYVKKGQVILEIADNDPMRQERLTEQVDAAKAKLSFARDKAQSYERQIAEFEKVREMIIESGTQMVEMAKQKVEAAKQDLESAASAQWQLELDNRRQAQLAREGIVANVRAQEARAKFEQSLAKTNAARAYVSAAQNEQQSKVADLEAKTREANAKIQDAQAKVQQAQGGVALAQKELAEIESKTSQFSQRYVRAPKDGYVLRLMAADGAAMLKEGAPLFTIVPETTERAVELWIHGNDVPLMSVGREVRLQFEGWPAMQFVGWPSVAVGTFGGEVVAIDGTDDGKGKFRVLVRPVHESDWPSGRFLRQGVRANGWVMLNQVSLGYEIWRQLNGFPPAIAEPDEAKEDIKKVKLPK